jgi:hypothetical protein
MEVDGEIAESAAKRWERDARFGSLPDSWRRRFVILDTSHLVDDLKEYVKSGATPARPSLIAHSFGGTLYFAPDHVLEEMYRDDGFGNRDKFHKLAAQSVLAGWDTPPDRFREVFETRFLPAIRFVAVDGMYEDHALALSIPHDADVPTGQLAVLLSPLRPALYATDRHLKKPGLAPRELQPVIVASATIEMTDGTSFAAGVVTVGVGAGLNEAVKSLADLLSIPPWVIWTACGGVLGWYLLDAERRDRLKEATAPAWKMIAEHLEDAAKARSVVETVGVEAPDELDDVQQVASLLARRSTAQTIDDLAARWPPERALCDIEQVLCENPCFVEADDGWQLGQTLVPELG